MATTRTRRHEQPRPTKLRAVLAFVLGLALIAVSMVLLVGGLILVIFGVTVAFGVSMLPPGSTVSYSRCLGWRSLLVVDLPCSGSCLAPCRRSPDESQLRSPGDPAASTAEALVGTAAAEATVVEATAAASH